MRTSSRLGKGGQVQIRPKAVCQRLEVDLEKKMDCHQWETTGKRIRHDLLGSYLARPGEYLPWSRQLRNGTMRDRSKRYDIEDAQIQKLVDIVYLANGPFTDLESEIGHRFKQSPSKLILRRAAWMKTTTGISRINLPKSLKMTPKASLFFKPPEFKRPEPP